MPKEHESLSEGKVALAKMISLRWLFEHGKQLLFSLCAIAVLFGVLLPLSKRFTSHKSDYLTAESAFTTWASKDKHDLNLFKEVSEPLGRHPELGAKFGTLIAQRLLSLGETKLAHEYAQAALKRTKALLSPYHALFSQNTLRISQGQLQEALEAAYLLKKDMADDEAMWGNPVIEKSQLGVGRTLYAYNLLRIATLEREVGSKEGEISAWDEVVHSAGWGGTDPHPKTYDPSMFRMLAENFQSGDLSLFDYIEQRKKELLNPS